jgi:hypothetical protein
MFVRVKRSSLIRRGVNLQAKKVYAISRNVEVKFYCFAGVEQEFVVSVKLRKLFFRNILLQNFVHFGDG